MVVLNLLIMNWFKMLEIKREIKRLCKSRKEREMNKVRKFGQNQLFNRENQLVRQNPPSALTSNMSASQVHPSISSTTKGSSLSISKLTEKVIETNHEFKPSNFLRLNMREQQEKAMREKNLPK